RSRRMKTPLRFTVVLALAIGVAVYATSAASSPAQLKYAADVRKSSFASDRLFNDLTHAIGGVDFADRVSFPNVTTRILVRIEVITPYDNHQTGMERWTIQHDGGTTASYIVRFVPDGKGGTNFAVSKDKGTPTH